MRRGEGVRAAFLGLNLALVGGVGLLFHALLAGGAGDPIPRLVPSQLAIVGAGGERAGAGQWDLVWRELDRPRPEPEPAPAPTAGPAAVDLEAAWDLLCVLTDPRDPFRCSAIVGAAGGGAQASLGAGDAFAGGTVAGIEVEAEGTRRRVRLRVRLPDQVQCLTMIVEDALPERQ